jgi:hypothetical protein
MENENALFERTSNRMHHLLQNASRAGHGHGLYDSNLQEVELRKGHSVADILHEDCICDDFLSLARHTLVWVGEGVFISMVYREAFQCCAGYEVALRMDILGCYDNVRVWRSPSAQTETVVCDVVVQLLARASFPRAHLHLRGNPHCSVSSNALAQLLESPCPSLRRINFCGPYHLTEDCLRALEGETCPDLQIHFERKDLSHFEPMRLQTFLRKCRGAIALCNCTIDLSLLSEVLRGDNKVTALVLAPQALNDANTTCLVDALKTNSFLTELSLVSNPLGDEDWIRMCQSIAQHPKLQKVCLRSTPSSESKILRTSAVVRMLHSNYVLQQVDLSPSECDEQIQQDVIVPYLRYARNIRALNDYRGPTAMHTQLLARAMRKVNNNPTLLWMILSKQTGIRPLGLGISTPHCD